MKEVRQYKKHLHKHLDNNNIEQRGDRLNQVPPGDWYDTHQEEYEKMDSIITAARRRSEQKCCKPKKFEWSPKLQQVYNETDVWNKALKQSKKFNKPSASLAHLARKAGIKLPSPSTERLCQHHLREIQRYRKEVERKAPELRAAFLQRQATAIAITDHKDEAKIFYSLEKTEKKQKMYRRIRSKLKPDKVGSITHILIPENSKPEDYPYNPKDIEKWETVFDPEEQAEFL